jgi:hypothetical protein
MGNEGVTLYFTCPTSPCDGATAPNVNWTGTPMQLGSQDTRLRGNPDHNHMLIWVDRTSSDLSPNTVSIAGGMNVFLNGRVYALHSDLALTGQAGEDVDLNLNVLANQIQFSGGNSFNFPWNEEFAPTRRVVTVVE